ncbi:hypothetical protein [Rhizobium sp. BK251]|nr:hypothetical protein [Rhizobium sp. BK251]
MESAFKQHLIEIGPASKDAFSALKQSLAPEAACEIDRRGNAEKGAPLHL